MKRYWRRRKYRRLGSLVSNKHNEEVSLTKGIRRGRFRKTRVTPKLRLKIKSSIKVLKRFRDAYVEMMLCFAGRLKQLNTGNVHLVKKIHIPRFSA